MMKYLATKASVLTPTVVSQIFLITIEARLAHSGIVAVISVAAKALVTV